MGLFSSPGRKLAKQAEENPHIVKEHLNDVQSLLTHHDSDARYNGAFALQYLAKVDKKAARTLLSESVPLLEDQDETTRHCISYVLSKVSEKYPDDVRNHREQVITLLKNDTNSGCRMNAASTLGNLGSKEAYSALEAAKAEEQNAEVREAIFEALEETSPPSTPQGSQTRKTGMLKNCPDCSTDFATLSGIPRQCPGCGTSIKELL
jgi:HEAT repeat protein